MCAMNNMRIPSPQIIFILLLLITISLGFHFLLDIQPGHSDVLTNSFGFCSSIIHFDIDLGLVNGLVLIVLMIIVQHPEKSFLRLLNILVFDPQPRSLIQLIPTAEWGLILTCNRLLKILRIEKQKVKIND